MSPVSQALPSNGLVSSLSQAFDLGFPPGVTMTGVDADAITNGEENEPSIFSSAGLSAGAFLRSPYRSHPEWANTSAPDIQVCTTLHAGSHHVQGRWVFDRRKPTNLQV